MLGLDKDGRRSAKSRLDERSLAARQRDNSANLDRLRRLGAIDRSASTGLDAVNYDTVAYIMRTQSRDRTASITEISTAPMSSVSSAGPTSGSPISSTASTRIETKADADALPVAACRPSRSRWTRTSRWSATMPARGVIPPGFRYGQDALFELAREHAQAERRAKTGAGAIASRAARARRGSREITRGAGSQRVVLTARSSPRSWTARSPLCGELQAARRSTTPACGGCPTGEPITPLG